MSLAEDLTVLDKSLNMLIVKYEQYFLGMEKREPLALRKEVETLIRQYTNVPINNTMYKFRFNTLVARFTSYSQQWNRILRLMDEGKYTRERFRMELHQKQGMSQKPVRATSSEEADIDRVYNEYLEARRSCNLPPDKVSREMIAESIARQKPLLEKKYGVQNLKFKVVIENNKPKIKATVKGSASPER